MKAIVKMARRHELRYVGFMVLFLLVAAIATVFDVAVTQTTGDIGEAAVQMDTGGITRYLLVMAALTGAKALFTALNDWAMKRFSGKTDHRLREGFARHFLSLPYQKLSAKNSGGVLSLYTSDLPKAATLMVTEVCSFLSGIVTVLVSAVFMARLQPWYTLVFFALFPPLIWMQAAISKPVMVHAQEAAKRRADYNAVVNDSLQNTSTVISYGLEDVMEERYQKSYAHYYEAMKKRIRMFVMLIIGGILGTLLPVLFVSIACGVSVANGTMTVGAFLAFTSIASSANDWLTMLSQQLGSMQGNAASLHQLEEGLNDITDPSDGAKTVVRALGPDAEPAVEFKQVRFAYDNDPVLDGISLNIRTGEKVAIVGPSGSGKSTVLKLILALYGAQQGTVRLFGHALEDSSKDSLRRRLSYVPQDSFLLPESIAANICCTESGQADLVHLRNAAQDAGILAFIESLPKGFDTILAENGENLSGGQRQRIAIARAFYRQAPVLLLDEATAALDPVTERAVLQSVYEASGEKTVVMVTHRLAAAEQCDRILVLDQGKIVEEGRFEELSRAGGLFAQLYQKQKEESQDDTL